MAHARLPQLGRHARRSGRQRATSWRRRVVLTAALLALLALEYVVFVGTPQGRRIDTRAILDAGTGRSWAFDRPLATSDVGHTLAAASFALFAAGIIALA